MSNLKTKRNKMETMNYKTIRKVVCRCMTGMLLLAAVSCDGTMEDSLRYNYPASGSNYDSGHVLLIVMDGAAGRSVQSARNADKTPNLKTMIAHAMYTDYGLADGTNKLVNDEQMTGARGWANLMTGNTAHGIKTETQLEQAGTVDNFLSRLVDAGASVSMYAASNRFHAAFSSDDMNAPELVGGDEAVKEHVLEELQLPQTSDLVVAQFKGVVDAADGIFYKDNGDPTEDVSNAIGKLDSYIGEFWNALKERPGYTRERWLIIVTSNYGGSCSSMESPATHYDDRTRNTFTLMYNPNLESTVQVTPGNSALAYTFYTPAYSYDNRYPNPTTYAESARLGNLEMGEFVFDPTTKEIAPIAIQFFLRASTLGSQKYVIMSKSTDMNEDNKEANGWFFHFNQDNSNRRICFGFGDKRAIFQTQNENVLDLDWREWHVVTLTLEPDPKKKVNTLLTIYLDGKLNNSSSQTNANMVKWYAATPSLATSKQAPLRIGGTENRDSQNTQRNTKGQQSKNYMYVSNLQIYNKALTAEEVELYAGKNQLHKLADAYPLWDNLVGYWPCDLEEDQLEPIMKNYAKDNKENDDSDDFVIDRGVANAWTSGSEVSSGMHPIPESDITYYSKTFNTVDVSRQIFSWLGKTVRWDWNMEGKAWKLTYTQLSDENN